MENSFGICLRLSTKQAAKHCWGPCSLPEVQAGPSKIQHFYTIRKALFDFLWQIRCVNSSLVAKTETPMLKWFGIRLRPVLRLIQDSGRALFHPSPYKNGLIERVPGRRDANGLVYEQIMGTQRK